MTDEERAAPSYESAALTDWRRNALAGHRWFDDHAVTFERHYTGSLACVPSRPTILTGHYPDVHGVTQTDGFGKLADDSRMRWLRPGEVPTLGNWFRAAGYDTHYDGKWHVSHVDLIGDDQEPLATNDADGTIDAAAVRSYLDADPLAPFGFSGWVGPEPHGGMLGNSGVRRDPLIADRVCVWLATRYEARRAGDQAALRPFLLVASFVNPHDIVLLPPWLQQGFPTDNSLPAPPPVPPSPTDDEDLLTKPDVQTAYRDAYVSGYGPKELLAPAYSDHAQEYRDLYYHLHAEVDGPIDRVRRAVTESGSVDAVIVRTSDHGELLGSHGGLHQKWFTLYDEATRVPFQICRVGNRSTQPATVADMPTSHVDLVPTLLAAAGIDEATLGDSLRSTFSEVHPLPGKNLMPVVDGEVQPDANRVVYAMTRDHILEGDSGLSALGRAFDDPTMLIEVLPSVATNIEGIVTRAADGHMWKLVRTFDDPTTWTQPGVAQLTAQGHRTQQLADQYELYDLTEDPIEADNRWSHEDASSVLAELSVTLEAERARSVPARNAAWPYVALARSDQ